MRGIVFNAPRDVSVEDVPDPAILEPGDALVRVTKAGICGSDMHIYNHGDAFGFDPGCRLDVQSVHSGVRSRSPFWIVRRLRRRLEGPEFKRSGRQLRVRRGPRRDRPKLRISQNSPRCRPSGSRPSAVAAATIDAGGCTYTRKAWRRIRSTTFTPPTARRVQPPGPGIGHHQQRPGVAGGDAREARAVRVAADDPVQHDDVRRGDVRGGGEVAGPAGHPAGEAGAFGEPPGLLVVGRGHLDDRRPRPARPQELEGDGADAAADLQHAAAIDAVPGDLGDDAARRPVQPAPLIAPRVPARDPLGEERLVLAAAAAAHGRRPVRRRSRCRSSGSGPSAAPCSRASGR